MKLLVLDFDGTMTDAEAEGAPYRTGYMEDLALLTGQTAETIEQWAAEFEMVVAENSMDFGWKFEGRIVAPAGVDPYLRVMPVARMILDRANVFTQLEERDRLLDRILYKYNYQKTVTAFRPNASTFLQQLSNKDGVETYIVTNSHTEPVQKKVAKLSLEAGPERPLDWLVERVHGSARKYIIDEDFEEVPTALELPNLNRPVLLRRKLYFNALNALRQKHGVDWADVIVIGDIFELDLCLPLSMGARVALMLSGHTPAYEREYLEAHDRGYVLQTLLEAGELVDTLSATQ